MFSPDHFGQMLDQLPAPLNIDELASITDAENGGLRGQQSIKLGFRLETLLFDQVDTRMVRFSEVRGVDIVAAWDQPAIDNPREFRHVRLRGNEDRNAAGVSDDLSVVPIQPQLAPGLIRGVFFRVDSDADKGFHWLV